MAETVNVSEVAFRAMQTGYCSYNDLSSCIGLEGALNIIEISQVAKYNEEYIKYLHEQDAQRRNNG